MGSNMVNSRGSTQLVIEKFSILSATLLLPKRVPLVIAINTSGRTMQFNTEPNTDLL
jgi:hypothetical protein